MPNRPVLSKIGLYSIMLVTTANKNFLVTKLNERLLQRKCCAAHSVIDDIELLNMNIPHLDLKHLMSTCSTTPNGRFCKTIYSGLYLGHAPLIDIHNHILTGRAYFRKKMCPGI